MLQLQKTVHLDSVLHKRNHHNETPVHRDWRVAPAHGNQRKSPCSNKDQAQAKISLKNNNNCKKKKKEVELKSKDKKKRMGRKVIWIRKK